jgi:hypothetical protein
MPGLHTVSKQYYFWLGGCISDMAQHPQLLVSLLQANTLSGHELELSTWAGLRLAHAVTWRH